MDNNQTDYFKYRGKCKEMCEAAVAADPDLTLVRGHYVDVEWGDQAHWGCIRKDGSIYDPSTAQFLSKGNGVYIPFNGLIGRLPLRFYSLIV